jgi:hypothetical protein
MEAAAFPPGAARHDDRRAPAFQGSGHIGIADQVQAELDQVGARGGGGVALASELGHIRPGHSDAQKW